MPQRKVDSTFRQELAKNLSDVAEYRRMPFLRGGLRIFNDVGNHGKVVGGSDAGYVLIKFRHQRWLHIYHPTWELAYFDKQGHILADYRTLKEREPIKHMQTIQSHTFSYLTNQGCEDTGFWTTEQFDALGLHYGEWNGEPYPLTDTEAALISTNHAVTPRGGEVMFGYSALLENKKYLITSIEYIRPVQYPPLEREYHELVALFSPYGKVVLDQDGPPDRVTILILVEMSIAIESFGHCNAWQRYLERGLGIAVTK